MDTTFIFVKALWFAISLAATAVVHVVINAFRQTYIDAQVLAPENKESLVFEAQNVFLLSKDYNYLQVVKATSSWLRNLITAEDNESELLAANEIMEVDDTGFVHKQMFRPVDQQVFAKHSADHVTALQHLSKIFNDPMSLV